jgi:hypothetical protein
MVTTITYSFVGNIQIVLPVQPGVPPMEFSPFASLRGRRWGALRKGPDSVQVQVLRGMFQAMGFVAAQNPSQPSNPPVVRQACSLRGKVLSRIMGPSYIEFDPPIHPAPSQNRSLHLKKWV